MTHHNIMHDTYEEYEEWFTVQGYALEKKATLAQWTAFNEFLLGDEDLPPDYFEVKH